MFFLSHEESLGTARHGLDNWATCCQAKDGLLIAAAPGRAAEYLHKVKVVLLATKHLTLPFNHQPSIHQLVVRWVVQRLYLQDKQEQHTHVAVSLATHFEGERRREGGQCCEEEGGRDECLDACLGWKLPFERHTVATTGSKVPELKGYLIMGLLNLHLKKKEGAGEEEKAARGKIFCGEWRGGPVRHAAWKVVL